MKGFIGSANIDTNSRLCMSSAVVVYKRAFCADDSVALCHAKEGNRQALRSQPKLINSLVFCKRGGIHSAQGLPDNPKNLASAQKQTYNRE
jgi:hypothetical protein